MNHAVIVGGGGSAGQSALAAIRREFPSARVTGTTSGSADLPGYDSTIHAVDLNQDVVDRVAAQAGSSVDVLIFTPAFGPLGFPVREATEAQVEEALRFSVRPMVQLAEALRAGLTVSYSAFYWLEHTLAAYGSMAYAKLAQERLAIREPARFRVVRAGTFRSKATRGITILLQRQMRSPTGGPGADLVAAYRKSGLKFPDFFFGFAFSSEQRAFGGRFESPHRETGPDDLTQATADVLSGRRSEPIVNVIGGWRWTDNVLPTLGPDFPLAQQLDNLP